MAMNIKQKRTEIMMSKEIIVSPASLLNEYHQQDISEPKCWLLEIPDGDCDIHVRWANESSRLTLSAGWRGMLLMRRLNLALRAGTARHQELPLFALAKLQVFIDESRGVQVDYAQQQWAQIELNDFPHIGTCADIEQWMLGNYQSAPSQMNALAVFLRQTECYCLIRFLLNESVNNGKLNVLGARYGLSYSHFRRLCRNALGNSAKNELRGWRIARALLDMVEERQSLTEVAMRYGYASSSHLSNDVRDAFGVSPRGIWNMINKKAEQ